MTRVRATLGLLAMVLAGCSTFHPAPKSVQPTENPPPPATPAPPPDVAEPVPTSAGNSPAPSAASVAPLCVPPEAKAKPKLRKPKPVVRKEAPPQLPTAPEVAETPAGGVVDATVKRMPVSVMSILGKRVLGPKGEDLGRVVDVLADASGRVRVAIVDFGGFLGVGDRRIAVDWPLLRFNPDGADTSLQLSVDRDKLKAAPEYKDIARPQTLMEPDTASAAGVADAVAEKK